MRFLCETKKTRHNLRHTKTFFQIIHSRGKHSKHYTSRVFQIPFAPPLSPIFGTKSLPRRRFLQHYYRDTFIESHRKPIEVPQISYGGLETCKQLSAQSSALYSAPKTFFSKKCTHAGSLVNTTLPACCIYHFMVSDSQQA